MVPRRLNLTSLNQMLEKYVNENLTVAMGIQLNNNISVVMRCHLMLGPWNYAQHVNEKLTIVIDHLS